MIKKILKKLNSILFDFKPTIKSQKKLEHIGTYYGGYDVLTDNLKNPVVISCGLGEDASFDIDMINNFNAKVISIDPTPRSIEHYNQIKASYGKNKTSSSNESGKLLVSNYNLEKVNNNNFIFINKAFWNENNKKIKLFFPKNKEHVSLSINKNPKFSEDYFIAETIDFKETIKSMKLDKVDILKLDIEGAEILVLQSILKNSFLPSQILVEFDIRRRPSFSSLRALKEIHRNILQKYNLININKKGDFTYMKKI